MMISQNISSLVISLSTLCEQVNKKGLASSAKPLILLVAGRGFEPLTFGL